MASADVTCAGSAGREIEADTTQRTATLSKPGGTVTNKSSDSVWIDENAGTVSTTNGSATSYEVRQNASFALPFDCRSFTFKTASGTSFLQYTPR